MSYNSLFFILDEKPPVHGDTWETGVHWHTLTSARVCERCPTETEAELRP